MPKAANLDTDQSFTHLWFFHFRGFSNKYWAFKQMRQSLAPLQRQEGLQFFKLLGSGGKDGFSTRPDWGSYALLTTWKDESDFEQFLKSKVLSDLLSRSYEHFEIRLRAFKLKGEWNGLQPFRQQHGDAKAEKIAVLTRASIRRSKLLQFWRNVPGVSAKLFQHEGVEFAKGVGEWPWIEQATLSIWDSQQAMQAFAYKGEEHAEVIRQTRRRDWYREEMFCRFEVVWIRGSWLGNTLDYQT